MVDKITKIFLHSTSHSNPFIRNSKLFAERCQTDHLYDVMGGKFDWSITHTGMGGPTADQKFYDPERVGIFDINCNEKCINTLIILGEGLHWFHKIQRSRKNSPRVGLSNPISTLNFILLSVFYL